MVALKKPPGQVTLMDLLLGIALFMPVVGAVSELQHLGGGALRYAVAVPSSLTLGALIVCLDWKIGKVAWLRFQGHSKQTQNAVALTFLLLDLLWIVLGVFRDSNWRHLSQRISQDDLRKWICAGALITTAGCGSRSSTGEDARASTIEVSAQKYRFRGMGIPA